MKKWKAYRKGLGTLAVLVSGVAPALGDEIPAAQQAMAPNPPTLGQKLGLSAGQRLARRYRRCETAFGQLLNNASTPLSTLTGGLIKPFCPALPSPQELAKPGAEGAAAQIKADEARAKARREAVRYLGTVDCRWWPEASAGLISALRTDRNECVRLEAALALQSGCCCTKQVIEALAVTVSGSDKDHNPRETSERVKWAAEGALQHCLACYESIETVPEAPVPATPTPKTPTEQLTVPPRKPVERQDNPPERLPTLGAAEGGHIELSAYYTTTVDQMSLAQVVSDGRRAMAEHGKASPGLGTFPTGSQDLAHIFKSAMTPKGGDANVKPVREPRTGGLFNRSPKAMSDASMSSKSMNEPVVMAAEQETKVMSLSGTPSGPTTPAPTASAPGHKTIDFYASSTSSMTPAASAVRDASPFRRMSEGGVNVVPMPTLVGQPPAGPPPTPLATAYRPATAAADRSAMALMGQSAPAQAGPNVPQLSVVLKGSEFPSQRAWAAESLAAADWKSHPEVVATLLTAANQDPAGTVRAECVHSLARMKVNTPQVISAIQVLKGDVDSRVRNEAAQALMEMGVSQTGTTVPAVAADASAPAERTYSAPTAPSYRRGGLFNRTSGSGYSGNRP